MATLGKRWASPEPATTVFQCGTVSQIHMLRVIASAASARVASAQANPGLSAAALSPAPAALRKSRRAMDEVIVGAPFFGVHSIRPLRDSGMRTPPLRATGAQAAAPTRPG